MSTMKPDVVWYPPQFPKQGRLPTQAALVGQNCKQQDSHELAYRNELCQAAGRLVEPPCCKTLHISLFFDGTGNNLNNDLYIDVLNIPPILPVFFAQPLARVTPVASRDTPGNWWIWKGRRIINITSTTSLASAPLSGSVGSELQHARHGLCHLWRRTN